jgi:hypothetical protein
MFRRMLVFFTALLWVGCTSPDGWLSRPDGDDNAAIGLRIRQLPVDWRLRAAQETANNNATKKLRGNKTFVIGTLKCQSGDHKDVEGKEVLDCLLDREDTTTFRTYESCIEDILVAFEDELHAGTSSNISANCKWVFAPGWAVDEVPDNWDPDKVTDEDIVRAMLESAVMPAWYAAARAAGVLDGAAWALSLCALSEGEGDSLSCPGSPLYPPGQTPAPPSGDSR